MDRARPTGITPLAQGSYFVTSGYESAVYNPALHLSGVWPSDDVPLDAGTPDPGSVRSTFGLCMELQLCSRIPELSFVGGPRTAVRDPRTDPG